jgi:signal transduction histidine kinase
MSTFIVRGPVGPELRYRHGRATHCLGIANIGPGIAPHDMDRIFESFDRGRRTVMPSSRRRFFR